MKRPILALRVSLRAIGVAVLEDDELSFVDGRHLRSRTDDAVRAVTRYVTRILDLTRPRGLVIDCPMVPGSHTELLLRALQSVVSDRGVEVHMLSTPMLLQAFAAEKALTRLQLRALVQDFWTVVAETRSNARPYLVDAAAAALYAESANELGLFPLPT